MRALQGLHRAVPCFILLLLATVAGGLEFLFVDRVFDRNPTNAGSYRVPLLVVLWVTKVAELAGVALAAYGLFIIGRSARADRVDNGALRLRSLVSLASWTAPIVVLGHIICILAPTQIFYEIGCYVVELAAGAAVLTVPPLLLGYLAAVTKSCGRGRVAALCAGGCVVVSLLHVLMLYSYVRQSVWHGELPLCFSALTWWAHTVSGRPLPGLSAYYWLGWQGLSFVWPILVYALALVALVESRSALKSALESRAGCPILSEDGGLTRSR